MTLPARLLRMASVLLAAVVAALAVGASVSWLVKRVPVRAPASRVDTVGIIEARLALLARDPDEQGRLDVVHFGDSTVYSSKAGTALSERFSAALRRRIPGLAVRVHIVASPGLDSFSYYFASPAVASARPDIALLCFNLATLSLPWRQATSHPEMSALIHFGKIPQALSLPIEWTGLTADALLRNWAVGSAGALRPWWLLSRAQLRISAMRAKLDEWLVVSGGAEGRLNRQRRWRRMRDMVERSEAGASRSIVVDGFQRYTRAGYEHYYRMPLAGIEASHPILQALRATLRNLASNSIHALVYATPLNVEHMGSVGMDDLGGIERTLAVVAELTRSEGAYFADLHDTQPDAAFRDSGAHLFYQGPDNPTTQLAKELARLVQEMLVAERRIGSEGQEGQEGRGL